MTETAPATASTAHHNDPALSFDALTPEIMRSRNSLKWSRYDGDVIGAWVAEMDLGTAPAVTAVLRRAVENGCLGYMPTGADRAAREAVASFHAQSFGWKVPVGM